MTVTIREARRDDEARWRALWADYLAFYGVGISDDITDLTWRRVFDPASAIFMRVAVVDDVVMGFALCLTHEGTWTSGLDCYLEDLFVDAEVRGRGLRSGTARRPRGTFQSQRLDEALLAHGRDQQHCAQAIRPLRPERRPHTLSHHTLSRGKPSYDRE